MKTAGRMYSQRLRLSDCVRRVLSRESAAGFWVTVFIVVFQCCRKKRVGAMMAEVNIGSFSTKPTGWTIRLSYYLDTKKTFRRVICGFHETVAMRSFDGSADPKSFCGGCRGS